jgi:spore coat protein U-like protein
VTGTIAGNLLNYNLYTTSGDTTVWGDGTGSTLTVAGTGAGMGTPQAVAQTVYGQIPDNAANQAVSPDTFADTITATVTY